jgi:ADP-ribose pyrophosphatase
MPPTPRTLRRSTPEVTGFRHLGDREVAQLDRIRVVRGSFEAPDGSTFERDVVRNQQVVAMVPIEDDGRTVLLVRQYRGPIDRELLEVPAGLCDVDGEDPLATARRELVEEVGRTADELELVAGYYPSAGFSDQFVRLYLARGLHEVAPDRQGIEEAHMTIVPFDLADLDDAIADGTIADSKTLVGLLLARDRAPGA